MQQSPETADSELLERFEQSGDQSAFAEIVRRHGPMVMATVKRNVSSNTDADDAFQVTFIKLVASLSRIRDKQALAAWLHQTARSVAISASRKHQRLRRLTNALQAARSRQDTRHLETELDQEEALAVLDHEITRLKPNLRAAVVSCYLEGMTQDRAAELNGVSPSTIRARLEESKKLLKKRLTARGVTLTVAALALIASESTKSSSMAAAKLADEITKKAIDELAKSPSGGLVIPRTRYIVIGSVLALFVLWPLMRFSRLVGSPSQIALRPPGQRNQPEGVASVIRLRPTNATLFHDDFSDGSHADESPVTWFPSPRTRGDLSVSQDSLWLTKTPNSTRGLEVVADAKEVVRSDVSVRVVARPIGTNSAFAVAVRTQHTDDTLGYVAAVGHSDAMGGAFLITAANLRHNRQRYLDSVNGPRFVPLHHDVLNEFTTLQINIFQNRITVWAWQAGTGMPRWPQFDTVDLAYESPGFIRLIARRVFPEQDQGGEAVFLSVLAASEPIEQWD